MDDNEMLEILAWGASSYLEFLQQSKKNGYVHPWLDNDISNLEKALEACAAKETM